MNQMTTGFVFYDARGTHTRSATVTLYPSTDLDLRANLRKFGEFFSSLSSEDFEDMNIVDQAMKDQDGASWEEIKARYGLS